MAQPRVFVSSTYYDLKYVRSSLELFIESLGFEPVLSEKGGVTYAPDKALDESCFREVQNCDIYVLIVGGRYGSEASQSRTALGREFFERYESVTKLEYKAAVDKDIPIYILVERSVYAEYHTYQKNRDSREITYAHVDSVNVYRFVDEILAQPRNNPVQAFDKYSEIEEWLRLQWAGLFRELMLRATGQQQIASLAAQVAELAEVNKTLRRYLEEVVGKVAPKDARKIIEAEHQRLAAATIDKMLQKNHYVAYLVGKGVPFQNVKEAVMRATSVEEFATIAEAGMDATMWKRPKLLPPLSNRSALRDLNGARLIVGQSEFPEPPELIDRTAEAAG
jgi:hypothetical protein